jgi:hypothetical protein
LPEIGQPSPKKGKAITDNTNNTTNNNDSINARARDDAPENTKPDPDPDLPIAQPVIDALITQGMPAKHFRYPDVITTIAGLCLSGATVNDFLAGLDRGRQFAEGGFGVKYLARIVESILAAKKLKAFDARDPPVRKQLPAESAKKFFAPPQPVPDWAK